MESISFINQNEQGTWVHPQVAIHLAQWVFNWMSGKRLDNKQKNK